VSWCFLQRGDMDGILDSENDLLPPVDRNLGRPHTWYKTVISCFRLTEMAEHYRDEGWDVRPLLVTRDLRDVWASMSTKTYARNGITAEDPPLRLRVRKFIADWESFRQRKWPILQYERFVAEPERSLREACQALGLGWDEAMLTWPKAPEALANTRWGNETFWATRGAGLPETLANHAPGREKKMVANADLQWLETEFRQFNADNHYPAAREFLPAAGREGGRLVPNFEATRRYEWETKRKPLRWILSRVGVSNRRLIERRSARKAA